MAAKQAFLGIDIGGTNVKIGAIAPDGTMFDQRKISTNVHRPPEEVIADMTKTATDVRKLVESQGHTILSVGVGIPGSTDYVNGVCKLLPNFPNGWKGVRIREQFEQHLQLPTFLINDVRAITLAEKLFGAGRTVSSMVMAAIGTGIGGGVVIDNELIFGKDGSAGEFGHINVEPDGILCGCGSRGCLECYASGPAIAGFALRALVQQNSTLIRDLVQGDYNKVTAAVVAKAAEQGDRIAQEILSTAGRYIGRAMAIVSVVMNPEMVVIGGGVGIQGSAAWGMRKTVKNEK
jgi:glucokinase